MTEDRSPTPQSGWSADAGEQGKKAPHGSEPRRVSLVRLLLLFVVAYASLQWGWESLRGSAIERWVIHDATVGTAASLIRAISPDVGATAKGSRILASGGGLNILNGCEGVEVMFLLIAALLAIRLPWRWKIPVLLLGLVWVFAMNQARILTLFYAYRSDRAMFDALHTAVLPVVMVALTAGYYYAVLHILHRKQLA